MAVIRVTKTRNFTVMSNVHLRDDRLTLKAKGLLSVILSLPDDWDYSIGGLAAICKEGRSAVKTALNELKASGYVRVTKEFPKEGSNRITYIYDVFERPQDTDFQHLESQHLESQELENCKELNTDGLTPEERNTDHASSDAKASSSHSSERPDYAEWLEAYRTNAPSLPGARMMSDKRKASVRSMLKQGITLDDFAEACRKAESSSFLRGGGENGWRATPDWMFNGENVLKVIEGKYDDRGAKQEKYNNADEEYFKTLEELGF